MVRTHITPTTSPMVPTGTQAFVDENAAHDKNDVLGAIIHRIRPLPDELTNHFPLLRFRSSEHEQQFREYIFHGRPLITLLLLCVSMTCIFSLAFNGSALPAGTIAALILCSVLCVVITCIHLYSVMSPASFNSSAVLATIEEGSICFVCGVSVLAMAGIAYPKQEACRTRFSDESDLCSSYVDWYVVAVVETFCVICPARFIYVFPIILAALCFLGVSYFYAKDVPGEAHGYRMVVEVILASINLWSCYIREVSQRSIFRKFLEANDKESVSEFVQGCSADLLATLIPKHVLPSLSNRSETQVDEGDHATVFRSDLVNFTLWSSDRPAAKVAEMLRCLIDFMDHRREFWGLTKVKTIGDAFWCFVGLIPQVERDWAQLYRNRRAAERQSSLMKQAMADRRKGEEDPIPSGPERMLRFAFAVRAFVLDSMANEETWDLEGIRIGIATGRLFGLVIGTQQISYEVFGSADDCAQALEAKSRTNEVHICGKTAAALEYCEEKFCYVFHSSTQARRLPEGVGQPHYARAFNEHVPDWEDSMSDSDVSSNGRMKSMEPGTVRNKVLTPDPQLNDAPSSPTAAGKLNGASVPLNVLSGALILTVSKDEELVSQGDSAESTPKHGTRGKVTSPPPTHASQELEELSNISGSLNTNCRASSFSPIGLRGRLVRTNSNTVDGDADPLNALQEDLDVLGINNASSSRLSDVTSLINSIRTFSPKWTVCPRFDPDVEDRFVQWGLEAEKIPYRGCGIALFLSLVILAAALTVVRVKEAQASIIGVWIITALSAAFPAWSILKPQTSRGLVTIALLLYYGCGAAAIIVIGLIEPTHFLTRSTFYLRLTFAVLKGSIITVPNFPGVFFDLMFPCLADGVVVALRDSSTPFGQNMLLEEMVWLVASFFVGWLCRAVGESSNRYNFLQKERSEATTEALKELQVEVLKRVLLAVPPRFAPSILEWIVEKRREEVEAVAEAIHRENRKEGKGGVYQATEEEGQTHGHGFLPLLPSPNAPKNILNSHKKAIIGFFQLSQPNFHPLSSTSGRSEKQQRSDDSDGFRWLASTFQKVESILSLSHKDKVMKIKTVGDFLMCAALSEDNGEIEQQGEGAVAMFIFGVDQLIYAHEHHISFKGGIQVGDVTGCVLGRDRLSYDLLGDPVNTASRLCTTSKPDQMSVSVSVYTILLNKMGAEKLQKSVVQLFSKFVPPSLKGGGAQKKKPAILTRGDLFAGLNQNHQVRKAKGKGELHVHTITMENLIRGGAVETPNPETETTTTEPAAVPAFSTTE